MTVTVSGSVIDSTGLEDARRWKVRSRSYREGSGGSVITTREQVVRVTAGMFSAELEPGPAVIENPDGDLYEVMVPDHDCYLWDLISVPIGAPVGLAADALRAAMESFLTDNSDLRELIGAVSDFDIRLSDTRTPTDGSVAFEKLDDDLQESFSLIAGVRSPYFQVADNGNVLNSYNAINNNQKVAKFGTTHYVNAEEPVYGFRVSSENSATYVQVGGGSTTGNAATQVEFYTAGNTTTTTGTRVGYFDSAGSLNLAGALLGAASTTAFPSLRLPHGVPPTSPTDGDVWTTATAVFARVNGATQQFLVLSGADSSPTASKLALRDGNANLLADTFISSTTTTATSAGTLALTIADTQVQQLTGTTTHTVKLPTAGVTAGYAQVIVNRSTGIVTVQSSAGNTICQVRAGRVGIFYALADTPTADTDWAGFAPTPSSVASSIAMRDSNVNVTASGFLVNPNVITASGGMTALTIASGQVHVVSGSTTHTVKLPTASIQPGNPETIINTASGDVTVQSSAGNTITTIAQGSFKDFRAAVATPTTAADWVYK